MAPSAPRTRRTWLIWAMAAGAGVGLSGCAQTALHPAAGAADVTAVAPGVWVLRGTGGEVGPDNRGRIGNLGFIVGDAGVLAIDAGVSAQHGQALLQAIRARTPLPLAATVLTHVRQEFVLGAAPLQAAGSAIVMHDSAARLMAARCDRCLKTLVTVLGDAEMAGSRVVKPDRSFDALEAPAAALGPVGRGVRVLAFGSRAHSSGPGDVVVWHEASRTLFAGGLLDTNTIPDIQDADLDGWRAGWKALRALKPARIVPGHGPITDNEAASLALINANERYLDQLSAQALQMLRRGVPLSEAVEAIHLPEFAAWDQYDTIHRRNASIMYLKHERALLQSN